MTAERQVGERLSERAKAVQLAEDGIEWCRNFQDGMFTPAHTENGWTVEMYGLADSHAELSRAYLSLARQLAEAEREKGRLREALVNIAHSYKLNTPGIAEQIARAALNPPDPPASPAEVSEDDHARAEHLLEAREVEDHQERKHAARGSE